MNLSQDFNDKAVKEFPVECPNCHEVVQAMLGETVCPNCQHIIVLEIN